MVKRCDEGKFFFFFNSLQVRGVRSGIEFSELLNLGDVYVCVYDIGPPDIDSDHNGFGCVGGVLRGL